MIIVGLTGILGSGKSTVGTLLRQRGLHVIDLDIVAKDSLTWDDTRRDIRETFGEQYVVDGRVDINRLRQDAFGSPEALRRLEAIVHPRVTAEAMKRVAHLKERGERAVVIEHPLLFEKGCYSKMDRIVVVAASMGTIKERLGRRGMNADDVERRLSFQIPLEEKRARADHVVNNDGNESHLAAEVDSLVKKIKKWEVMEHAPK